LSPGALYIPAVEKPGGEKNILIVPESIFPALTITDHTQKNHFDQIDWHNFHLSFQVIALICKKG
jgi:hypothetical protein